MHLIEISDLHLGQTPYWDGLKAFADDLKRVRPQLIILAGDILELSWFTWDYLMEQEKFRSGLDALREMATYTETRYIPGNHDPLKKLDKELLQPIHITEEQWAEYDGVLYTHGHIFDITTKVCDSLLKLPIKSLLPGLYRKLYGTPYEVKLSGQEKDYREYVGWIFGRAMMWAIARSRKLVYGHTHAPMLVHLRNTIVANSGDLRDSLSYVEAREGKLYLRYWRG